MGHGIFMGLAAFLAISSPVTQAADVVESAALPEQQSSVAMTVYSNDIALIKDNRQVPLKQGGNTIAWQGVSTSMRPETAILRDTAGHSALQLIEQNFNFGLLTPNKLLEQQLGKKVRVIKTHPQTGAETSEEATLLAFREGVVLKFADRIETQAPGRIVFSELPSSLREKPTLSIQVQSQEGGVRPLELSYLTSGLSWKADYVAELSADESSLSLNGWATLTNESGAAYNNVKLQLVAGDVNLVTPLVSHFAESMPATMPVMRSSAKMPEPEKEPLLDYHLYNIEQTISLEENQIKQIALMSAPNVSVTKEYRLLGRQESYWETDVPYEAKRQVTVGLSFKNQAPGLGIPLPKGVMRVYKKDANGAAQFIGEDRIEHSAKNDSLRLNLGDAFDISASYKQTDFKYVDIASSRNLKRTNTDAPISTSFESAHEIELKNVKKEAVSVKVLEPIPGDWRMMKESHPHSKEGANQAAWNIVVPAEGRVVLSYRFQTRINQ